MQFPFFFSIKSRVFASISGIIRASFGGLCASSRQLKAFDLQHRSTMLHLAMFPDWLRGLPPIITGMAFDDYH